MYQNTYRGTSTWQLSYIGNRPCRIVNTSRTVCNANVFYVNICVVVSHVPISFFLKVRTTHCGNFKILVSLRFYVKSILRILCRIAKTAIFAILRAVNFVQMVNFSLKKSTKIHKNQNSEPLNVVKWLILNFKTPKNWFHVKSEWYKNHEISTQCKNFHLLIFYVKSTLICLMLFKALNQTF